MVHSTKSIKGGFNDAAAFMVRRVFRIVPLYWVVTLLSFVVLYFAFGRFAETSHLFESLTFQYFDVNNRHPEFPLYVPGWTLTFEMFFYLVFAVALLLGKQIRVWVVALFMSAIAIIGHYDIYPEPDHSFTKFLLYTIHLEFVYGMALAWAYHEGYLKFAKGTQMVVIAALVAVILGLGAFGYTRAIDPFSGGLLMAVICKLALIAEQNKVYKAGDCWLRWGELSYAIFFTHLLVFNALSILILRTYPDCAVWAYPATLILLIPVASLAHKCISKPLQEYGRSLSRAIS